MWRSLLKKIFQEAGAMNDFIKTLKGKLTDFISEISASKSLFVKNPKKDFTRKRKLPFEDVMTAIISIGGNSINKELLDNYGYNANTPTPSAFIQQRDKIKPFAFEQLFRNFTDSFENLTLYKGFRLLAVDGSDLHTPTNPQDAETHIKCRPTDKGYNVFYLNALYDLLNRIYVDANVKTKRNANERAAFIEIVERSNIKENVIVTADRGYENYNTFAHIENKGWNYVLRVKDIESNGILSYLQLPKDGEFDLTLRFILTKKTTREVKDNPHIYRRLPSHAPFDFLDKSINQFYPIVLRVVRFKLLDGSYKSVVTNLAEDDFTTDEIKHIYSLRWGIETSFRKLKHAIGLNNFHSKKQEHIVQEIFARIIMYNFVEMATSHIIISKARKRYPHQVNFTAATHICRCFLRICGNMSPHDVESLIRKNTVPIRPGRKYPCKPRFRSAVCFVYRVA